MRHVHSLQKDSEAYQHVVHNLTWSGVYLMSTLSNTILQKLLTLVPLTATGPEVYIAAMTNVLFNSCDSLVGTVNHVKSLKLKDRMGVNVEDCCDAILVDVEHLESAGSFKPDHLSYIICIFENTSDYRFHIWATHNYK